MFTPAWMSASYEDAARLATDASIDVWLLDLDAVASDDATLLSDEEKARAARFAFPVHAGRFAAARGALRKLLGSYLACAPQDIAFDIGAWGKPALRGVPSRDFAFNLAHSDAQALIAIGPTKALGVDIERIRPMPDWRDIATRTFAPSETRALLSLRSDDQLEAFFACWTRKEAVVKLWGEGLSADLTSFEVNPDPHMFSCSVSTERRDHDVNDIKLSGFKTDANAWAALAAPAGARNPRFWRLR